MLTEAGLDFFYDRFNKLLGFFFVGSGCGNSDVNFSSLGISCDGGIGLGIDEILDHGLCFALADSYDLNRLGKENAVLSALKIEHYLIIKHCFQLDGRSGKQDECILFRLENNSGCSTVCIRDSLCSLGNKSLLPVILCGFDSALRKIIRDGLSANRIFDKRKFVELSNSFLGHVIFRRSEAAG